MPIQAWSCPCIGSRCGRHDDNVQHRPDVGLREWRTVHATTRRQRGASCESSTVAMAWHSGRAVLAPATPARPDGYMHMCCMHGILPIGWCQSGGADSAGASKLETIPSSSTADSGNELPRSAPRIMHTCALSAWGYTCPTCTISATMALNSGLLVYPAFVTRPRRLLKLEVPDISQSTS